jgi:hypothetical protein
VELEPGFAGFVEVFDEGFGEGISETSGDEDGAVVLVPVGQTKAVLLDRLVWIEEHIRSSAVLA